jgi:ABC-type transport system involved in multi-copper enzyme maturation permease subunit
VLSLLAILFTYDAINGEREGGTLQLTFSNPVPRAKYILGKLIGSWLGLVIPLSIPILLSILLVLIMKIPMTPLHWQKLAGLLFVSLLYFTFFIALGLLTSALSRRSGTSFLISLVIWVFFVFIVPRAGIMAAGQFVEVPSVAEMKSRQAAYTKERQDDFQAKMSAFVQSLIKRQMSMLTPNMTPQERNEMSKNLQGELEKEISKERKVMEADITDYGYRLHEERRNRQAQQEKRGFLLSRFSPASSFRLAAMNLAETDVLLKTRAEKAMVDFRSNLLEMAKVKTREQGSEGTISGIRTKTYQRNDGTTVIGFDRRTPPTVNPEDVPIFVQDPRTFGDTASDILMDIGLLAIYSIVCFSITFVAFLRYDVR